MDLGGEQRPSRRVTANTGITDLLRSHMGDHDMLALGSCIAGFGILVAGLLSLLFRHPNAPRWTRPEIVAMLICVPLTAIIGVGLGYIAWGVYRLLAGTGDPRELLVLLAVLIILVAVWRGLRIRQRLRDYAAATGGIAPGGYLATEPSLAIDEQPPPRPKPPAPSNPRAA
jgi:hypothetical protein